MWYASRSIWGGGGGKRGGPGYKISRFSLDPVEVGTRLEWRSQPRLPIMSGRTWSCKPRYKRQAGELSAYWSLCPRLNDVHGSQGESHGYAA